MWVSRISSLGAHAIKKFTKGSSVYRRQRLLELSSRGRIAEVAGGTTAECVAVWCCGPCIVVNLLVLAVYKLPAVICRKALRRRRRSRMLKKGLLPLQSSAAYSSRDGWDSEGFHIKLDSVSECKEVAVVVFGGNEVDKELMELEKEMWSKFCNTGFWRSPSQRK